MTGGSLRSAVLRPLAGRGLVGITCATLLHGKEWAAASAAGKQKARRSEAFREIRFGMWG